MLEETNHKRIRVDSERSPTSSIKAIRESLQASQQQWHDRVKEKEIIYNSSDRPGLLTPNPRFPVTENSLLTEGLKKSEDESGKSHRRPVSMSGLIPSSMQAIHESLGASQQQWRNRVAEKDVSKFTVAGRMEQSKLPHTADQPSSISVKEEEKVACKLPAIPIMRTIKESVQSDSKNLPSTDSIIPPVAVVVETRKTVEVPKFNDTDFSDFFSSEPISEVSHLDDVLLPDLANEDLSVPDQFLAARRAVRPKRRKPAQASNPLEALSKRTDLRSEYEESRPSSGMHAPLGKIVGASEAVSRSKSMLSQSALAGLAAKADFSNAKGGLRHLDESQPSVAVTGALKPFKETMLLHIKGRRRVQVRLVSLSVNSMNSGDCFLLVTKQSVFAWFGLFSNVVEKNKTHELAQWICQHQELSYRGSSASYFSIFETAAINDLTVCQKEAKNFWLALGFDSPQPVSVCGAAEEDELYETLIQCTNRVYQVTIDGLVPYTDYWGTPIKHSLLQTDQAYVFDFGTEVYLWTGKKIKPDVRQAGIDLVKQAYEAEFDYSDCRFNPFDPLNTHNAQVPAFGSRRPAWTMVGKVTEKGETVLFKEKFIDWPEAARFPFKLDKAKGKAILSHYETKSVIDPYPVDQLYREIFNEPPPDPSFLTVNGRFIGRGCGEGSRYMDGILRRFRVEPGTVSIWHISESVRTELSPNSHGQFHQGDTYVIRWSFQLFHVGVRDSSARSSAMHDPKNEQCVFFFWQGSESNVTDKCASALMTMELDEEKWPQVRVTEGMEPPAFCRIFDGRMIIHVGKRYGSSLSNRAITRLFVVRGELPSEAHLMEVTPKLSSLRSGGAFLLLSYQDNENDDGADRMIQAAWLWFGILIPDVCIQAARHVVDRLKESCPSDMGISLPHVSEAKQTENSIGPVEFTHLLTGGDSSVLPASPELPLIGATEYNHDLLVVWHLTVHLAQQLCMRRLNYPLQPDASVASSLQPVAAFSSTDTNQINLEKNVEELVQSKTADDPLLMAEMMKKSLLSRSEVVLSNDSLVKCRLGFPFLLQAMYGSVQPAIYMILANPHTLYLWQGWWPTQNRSPVSRTLPQESDGDVDLNGLVSDEQQQNERATDDTSTSNDISSVRIRFNALRRAAMETAQALSSKIQTNAVIVYAGLEPPQFLDLFPPCERDPEAAAYFKREENKADGQTDSIGRLLESMRSDSYTLAELQQNPPGHLDCTHLERYLSDQEFQQTFQMTKSEFDELPHWRRRKLKIEVDLF